MALTDLAGSASIDARILEDDGRVATARTLDRTANTLTAALVAGGIDYVELRPSGTDTSYRMGLSAAATGLTTALPLSRGGLLAAA
ncbi:MAG: hypothetical protein ACJ8AW_44515 [Rhodopila sp.]